MNSKEWAEWITVAECGGTLGLQPMRDQNADLAEAEMRIADLDENWRTAQRQEQYLDAKVEEYVKTIEDMEQEAHEQEKRLSSSKESYQHLTAALAHTIEERDAIAAKLAECKRLSRERDTMLDEAGNKILALKAELADYRAYYEWSVSPQKNGDIPEVITGEVRAVIDRIEARRAKEKP